MALYSIEWKSSAYKELKQLPRPTIARIVSAVDDLAREPRPDGVRKLTATQDTYRIRVGEYRIIYNIFDKRLLVVIIKVRDRKEAYR